jgi:glycosyltransferase involved in cell wall biosynthesis
VFDRVFFVGYIDNPWELIAASDVFLLPSRWEGMSNAALESLACGTPVIATAESGGILELSKCAKQGAVVVTSTEIEFCIEMEKFKSGNSKQLKDSLLPERYCLENVLEAFNSQL